VNGDVGETDRASECDLPQHDCAVIATSAKWSPDQGAVLILINVENGAARETRPRPALARRPQKEASLPQINHTAVLRRIAIIGPQ
jgi:hypothetical protein